MSGPPGWRLQRGPLGPVTNTDTRSSQAMQRLKLLVLALFATFAFGAVASSMASAEELPNILPVGGEFTVSGNNPELLNSILGVKCEKVTGSGKGDGVEGMTGHVTLLFENCEAVISGVKVGKCTSLKAGTTTGDINVLANYDIQYLLPSSEKKVNIAVLLESDTSENHVHFTCGIQLVLVLGCVASDNIEPTNTLINEFAANFLVKTSPVEEQIVKEIDDLKAEKMIGCKLESMTGSNADEPAFELALTKIKVVPASGDSTKQFLIMA
jgi:hypothetical protein